jgi:hypothetical protein
MNPLNWTAAEWGVSLAVLSVVGVREWIKQLRHRQRTRR